MPPLPPSCCGKQAHQEGGSSGYEKAAVGLAFDGDADRMLAVDEHGNVVDGDQIMAICGNYMKSKGTLKKDTIVVTVMTNLGFTLMGQKEGIHVEKTKVGDRYVLENMRKNGYNIGGEQSGHVIFLDDNTTGDGLLSALHLLEVMVNTGKPLSELAEIMEVLPQALVNAKVPNHKKEKFMEYQEIADAVADVEKKFKGEGQCGLEQKEKLHKRQWKGKKFITEIFVI